MQLLRKTIRTSALLGLASAAALVLANWFVSQSESVANRLDDKRANNGVW